MTPTPDDQPRLPASSAPPRSAPASFPRRTFLALAAAGCAGRRPQVRMTAASAVHDAMADLVARGEIPGAVTLVSRAGQVVADVVGADAYGGRPLRRDALFRISSMTKPMTAAAAMILVDEGRLRLDEPVDRLLPELAGRRVLRRIDGPIDDTVPARRPITTLDLLTFRLGFGQTFVAPGTTPIQRAEAALGTMTLGPPKPPPAHPPDEWLRRFATLPLMFQPGERWLYGTGAHLLGVLVARASGQPLETFLRERLFEPLGMKDTAFSVPAAQIDRLVPAYAGHPPTVVDGVTDSQWARPPVFPDGAAGLVATADDCLAFARMMLDRGGPRVLSSAAIQSMTTDHLTADQRALAGPFLAGRSWGLGLAVPAPGGPHPGFPTGYGWDGGFGSSFAWDPARGRAAVLLTQQLWDAPSPPAAYRAFWTAVG